MMDGTDESPVGVGVGGDSKATPPPADVEVGLDDDQDAAADPDAGSKDRTESVDLSVDKSLSIDISDALSERDKVKFTVHTVTTMTEFKQSEFSVVRQHEEFVWLHDRFVESEEYAGYIIPPAPIKPDFDASREKLIKLGEGEGTMTKEEFNKMKAELEAEYLASFKKTVAMHEVFLQRLAAHPTFRSDVNFQVFLEYDQDLSVRGKNKKEKFEGFLSKVNKSVDEVLLSGQKDNDDFFEREKTFLMEYHARIKDATFKCDRMSKSHKSAADTYIKIADRLVALNFLESSSDLSTFLRQFAECLEKIQKIEARVSTDEDLKLSDTLRYYTSESAAAKDLLYRRLKCLAHYEAANKTLDKARMKNKEVKAAEEAQEAACNRFESMSELGKSELKDVKRRRVGMFRKNLVDLVNLEIKHARAHSQLIKNTLSVLKEGE